MASHLDAEDSFFQCPAQALILQSEQKEQRSRSQIFPENREKLIHGHREEKKFKKTKYVPSVPLEEGIEHQATKTKEYEGKVQGESFPSGYQHTLAQKGAYP